MVLKIPHSLCVTCVGVLRVHVRADVWVFQVLVVHFCEVDVLCGTDEAKCAVEFVVVTGGFLKYVVLGHVAGHCVHSLLGEGEPSDGIADVFCGHGDSVELCCDSSGPMRVIDRAAGDGR